MRSGQSRRLDDTKGLGEPAVKRRVFYSFHYQADSWRAAQVRLIGAIEGNRPCTDNDWESIARGGEPAIKRWVSSQLAGTSAVVVLIGAKTAGRKWIEYEVAEAWNSGKGVVGIYVHRLRDRLQQQAPRGANPFATIHASGMREALSSYVKTHEPPVISSTETYRHISQYIARWIDEAIAVRNRY